MDKLASLNGAAAEVSAASAAIRGLRTPPDSSASASQATESALQALYAAVLNTGNALATELDELSTDLNAASRRGEP